jgi:hypothetical protein
MKRKYVAIWGTLLYGYTVVGPFDTMEQARDYVDSDPDGSGNVAELDAPAEDEPSDKPTRDDCRIV